nr:tRNA lysidine(34) synthetase TilS [Cohnella zeiphila]
MLMRIEEGTRGDPWRSPGAIVVAAVSGGPDSMTLLHLLRRMAEADGFAVVAAHVNHRFRGAEADAEEDLVKRTAASWGIPCESAAIDVPAYIASTGMNTQEAAREKRYEYLTEVARRHGARAIALGHHADDQAETLLMRLIRGTGIAGLAGIPARRAEKELELVRPLLRIPKRELVEYAERHGVPYAVDSSNADTHYFRNEVRLAALPLLERYNPQFRASLLRLADMASGENDYMEAEAGKALAETAARSGEGWTLDRRRFRGLHVALQRRLIKLILKYVKPSCGSPDYERIEEAVAAIAAERPAVARIDLGGGWALARDYDDVYIGPPKPAREPFEAQVRELDGEVAVADARAVLRFSREDGPGAGPPASRWEAAFDEAELALPLTVRSRRPGDRIEPVGLNGSKKVQDMFVDAKIPKSARDEWPLLADAEGKILWLPGLRRSRHALPNAGTRTTVRVVLNGDFRTGREERAACSE